MEAVFDKASLEVFYKDDKGHVAHMTLNDLKEKAEPANIAQVKSALDQLVKEPTGDFVVVNRTRYTQVEGA